MATVYSRSLDDADVVDVEFLPLTGSPRPVRLFVDFGFTGRSSLVLGRDLAGLLRAELTPAPTSGALQGTQERGWVTCQIAGLGYQSTVVAIFTDLSPLSLPPGIHGMAGLSFLRQFPRWGAERTET